MVRSLRARISEGNRGPACAAERRASDFQMVLDETLSERSRRRRGELEVQQGGAMSTLFSHLPRPHLAFPARHPALAVRRPRSLPGLLCQAGHSRLPLRAEESLLHDLTAGCLIPGGGGLGLCRAAVTALPRGGSSSGGLSGSSCFSWCLLPGSWLCTWGVRGSCRAREWPVRGRRCWRVIYS